MKRAVFVSIFFFLFSLTADAEGLPKFKVTARDTTTLALVVPPATTKGDLKNLILAFRNARQQQTLSILIPATTPGGAMGNYGVVWIFIFTEPNWATENKLRAFIRSSLKSASDRRFDKEYARHIKAEYYYSLSGEHGNLGYDDGMVRSPGYAKIF